MENRLDIYKKSLKDEIVRLVDQKNLNLAKDLIAQYENIISEDKDLYSIKSVIYSMEGNIDSAEDILIEGLNLYPNNVDMLYNMAYIMEIKECDEKALLFYKRAYNNTSDIDLKQEIIDKTNFKKGILENRKNVFLSKNAFNKYNIDKNEKYPRFSIVIPTRNSHHTLYYTLKTCINQDYSDYEIILSDNSDDDKTIKVVRKINSDKIKYFRTSEILPMTEHFNFAISKANGEYVIVLGSDDGLLFHALKLIDFLLNKLNVKMMRWDMVFYGWPNVGLDSLKNVFRIPNGVPKKDIQCVNLDSLEMINKVCKFELSYNILPMLYMNSVVKKELIINLKERTGEVYKSLSPDIYSGFAFAYIVNNYLTIKMPMSIGGASDKSNGLACIHSKKGSNNEIMKDFFELNKKSSYRFHDNIPYVKCEGVAVADSFIWAKKSLFPDRTDIDIERTELIERCINSLYEDDEMLEDNMKKIFHSLYDNKELQERFFKEYLSNKDFHGYKRPITKTDFGFNASGGLNLDASEFGVKDVYGAAELFAKITGLR